MAMTMAAGRTRSRSVGLVVTPLLLATFLALASTASAAAATPPAFDIKWGSYGVGAGQFNSPGGLAVDASGDVYVVDTDNNRIEKFNSDGVFITAWGSHGTGDGQFDFPWGVAVDASGDVYVTDANNSRVEKFDSSGDFITKWGSFGSGDDQLDSPYGIQVDSSGDVYVADLSNNRVQIFDSSGNFLSTLGSYGSGDGQFYQPSDVAFDSSGDVYVTDTSNERIEKFTSSGSFLAAWGSFGTDEGQFNTPMALAIDGSGTVYVADSNNGRIQEFDTSGVLLTAWGSYGSDDGQLSYPYGVDVDGSGDLYVPEEGNNRVQEFKPVSSDTTPPTITLAAPYDGASYTLGQAVTSDYSCQDEGGGSGLASCLGDVASGSAIDTSVAGTYSFTVDARDNAGNLASVTNAYTVLAGSTPPGGVSVPPGGGTVTTDPGDLGPTESVPVQTTVHTPNGGTVTIDEGSTTQSPPSAYEFLGQQVTISAPDATNPADPLVLAFSLDASLNPDPSVIQMSRDGSLIAPCDETHSLLPCASIPASVDAHGDLTITVYTMEASIWNFAVHAPFTFTGFLSPAANPPTVNVDKPGNAIPVRFTLGGNQGRAIMARGYPTSLGVTCDSSAPRNVIKAKVDSRSSGLKYSGGRYTYAWKTHRAWAGTCRELVVKLADGSVHLAVFRFK